MKMKTQVSNVLVSALLSTLCLGAANAMEGLNIVAVHNAPQ